MAALPRLARHRSEMPMRAALDDGTGRYVVHDVPMPEDVPGAALIRVRRTGICGSDLHLTTARDDAQSLPSGHEVAGEIVELPAGENRLKVGDRVALETIGAGLCCGDCFYCNDGQFKHCNNLENDTGGGFAEYMTRRPTGLFPLDDRIDWVDAALVEPMAVSVHAIRYCRVPRGSTVAVIGSATIGLSCIAAARHAGVGKIIASGRYPQQREAALAMGADEVVGSEPGELEEACLSATGGLGADVALETVGGHLRQIRLNKVSGAHANRAKWCTWAALSPLTSSTCSTRCCGRSIFCSRIATERLTADTTTRWRSTSLRPANTRTGT